jgi:alpha-L-fucosidase
VEGIVHIKSWGPGTVVDSSAVVMDIEKGSLTKTNPYYWQAETSVGSWYYNGTTGVELSTQVIVHNLLDVVSKNGNFLLNVGLKPDGTLLENERQALQEIGDWLEIHGEGVYDTRAWKVFGEVDTELVSGDFEQNKKPLTARDIRYTHKENELYAFFMDKPAESYLVLPSVTSNDFQIASIQLLSEGIELDWEYGDDSTLVVELPNEYAYQHAYGLKIRYQ